MIDWFLVLAIFRATAVVLAMLYSFKVRNWLSFAASTSLFFIVILNSFLRIPNVVVFLGTPFTFLFVMVILTQIRKDNT